MAGKSAGFKKTFAHLIGLGASAAKAEGDEPDERERKEGETDDEYEARMKALDDDEKEKEEARKRAEADGDEEGDDESDDGEMAKASPVRGARLRERARCAAIFATPEAAANPALAAELAFNQGLSRSAAIRLLKAGAAAPQRRQALAARMSREAPTNPGPGAPAATSVDPHAATAAAIVAAGRKRRGEI